MLNRLPIQQTSSYSRAFSRKEVEPLNREVVPVGVQESSVSAHQHSKPRRQLSILLIDDEPEIRRLLSNALTIQGYLCQEADNGVTGLAMLQLVQPDLILLDITMPGLDGLGVLQEIRRRDITVGVIMVSALNPERFADKAFTDGADAYIKKPFRTQTIFQEIERVSCLVYWRRHSLLHNEGAL